MATTKRVKVYGINPAADTFTEHGRATFKIWKGKTLFLEALEDGPAQSEKWTFEQE